MEKNLKKVFYAPETNNIVNQLYFNNQKFT